MEENVKPTLLNLGCGLSRAEGWVNVDKYGPAADLIHDLDVFPYPWDDNSVDQIITVHVLEHLNNWWGAFEECARILKPGGVLEIRVPDESSSTSLGYRDHKHVFHLQSFHGAASYRSGNNAWAKTEEGSVPLKLVRYTRVPYKKYNWMKRFPKLLEFCADHMRNFIWEQQFIFEKFIPDREAMNGKV